MKITVIIILTFIINLAQAQVFEGTVVWSMKLESTDPYMKSVSDKMAMRMIMKTKRGNSITLIDGGMIGKMETLYLKDKGESYVIDRVKKTYLAVPASGETDSQSSERKVAINKTSETMEVLKYTCTKYVVTATEASETTTIVFWTTDELKDVDPTSIMGQNMGGSKQSLFYKELPGVPLRIETALTRGTMILEVTEIKRESLSDSDFVIPSDYEKASIPGK